MCLRLKSNLDAADVTDDLSSSTLVLCSTGAFANLSMHVSRLQCTTTASVQLLWLPSLGNHPYAKCVLRELWHTK